MDNNEFNNLPLNSEAPKVIHIDLNSCFATVEQQANKHLRGKPLLIAAYNSPRGCVVAPSIEAKQYGVRTGNRVLESKLMAPNAVVRTPDPALIRDVHVKFKKICCDYTPDVFPKSIDELILDFHSMDYLLKKKTMQAIAQEIKTRIKKEVGEWIRCSVGISTNRFLAKVAASYKKPEGLVTIDHRNLLEIYDTLELTDLPYIKLRNQSRLKAVGIHTIKDFLKADIDTLKNIVFQSVNGYYWYKRIRGYEVDAIEFDRKSFGQDYSLQKATNDPKELSRILMKLCEKMGRRLRKHGKLAYGVHVAALYLNSTYWHMGRKFNTSMYTTMELYDKVKFVLQQQSSTEKIAKISVSCYGLADSATMQMSLFDRADIKLRRVSDAIDKINDKYGEFVIVPATMMNMNDTVIDRISFGAVKEIQDLYNL